MSKRLMLNMWGESYGTMGEDTNTVWNNRNTDFPVHVGDMVSFKVEDNDLRVGIVIKKEGEYKIMGSIGQNFLELKDLQVVLKYNLVNQDIANRMHRITIKEATKLTKEQIEAKLGYSIEIIGGKA